LRTEITGWPLDQWVSIFGEEYQVMAKVKVIKSMSVHSDYEDLLHFLACQDPKEVKKIFLVHGAGTKCSKTLPNGLKRTILKKWKSRNSTKR